MTGSLRMSLIATSLVAMGAIALATPAMAAPDYQLNASGIEQTVLRAQMPKTLGSWHQNLYFANDNESPAVCWSTKGTQMTLPKANKGGLVGYEVNSNITGGVTLFQYKDQKSADAALAALQSMVCPDSPKVGTDSGPENLVQASAGSDFTSSDRNSMSVGTTYDEGGVKVTTLTITTVVGVGVVQTSVTVSGPAASSKSISKASDLNKKWHSQAVAAYEGFGSGGSH